MNANNILQRIEQSEVEWKKLGEVTEIKTGQSISKQKISENEGIYPVINSGREPLGYINEWNTENDPIGITTRGAGVGSITWQNGKYFRGNLNYSVSIKNQNELNVRFLYHILLEYQESIHALCTFTGIPALNASELKILQIPIPPISLQKEIVNILDKLTELKATLKAELSLREKQYQYYRDYLLTFSDDVEWKTLGDIAHFSNGKGHEKDIVDNGKYIVVNSKFISTNGDVIKYSDKQIFPLFINDILLVMSDLPNGKALAKTFFVDKNDKYTLNQRICSITVRDNKYLLPKYLDYILNRNRNLLKYDNGIDQTNLKKVIF